MEAPPDILGGAEVVYWSVIDGRQRPTGNCRHIVAGELQGSAAGLAICQHEGKDSYYLFFCDEDWNIVADGWHQTFDEALRQAEFEYEGISATWNKV